MTVFACMVPTHQPCSYLTGGIRPPCRWDYLVNRYPSMAVLVENVERPGKSRTAAFPTLQRCEAALLLTTSFVMFS